MVDSPLAEIAASLTALLDAQGCDYNLKWTRHGHGLSLFVRGQDGPHVSAEPPTVGELRAACLAAMRARTGRQRFEERIRLRDVAQRLKRRSHIIGKALDEAGVTVRFVGGKVWVFRDAQWNRFVGTTKDPVLV